LIENDRKGNRRFKELRTKNEQAFRLRKISYSVKRKYIIVDSDINERFPLT